MIRITAFLFLTTLAQAGIIRGPHVQMPDDLGPFIVWTTDVPVPSALVYGFTDKCTNGKVVDNGLTTNHALRIDRIKLDTNHYYRIEGQTYRLATKRTAKQPFRFAVIGDFGDGSQDSLKIARQVNAQDFHFLLTVGDNIYPNGERANYDPHWFKPYASTMSRVPTFPALGNHDVASAGEGGQPFLDFFRLPENGPANLRERNYSFDYGNAHFVAIDSNPYTVNDKKTVAAINAWVAADLAATKQPWKFAYFHHPPFSSRSSKHPETESVQKQLVPLLQAGGVQVIFTGHNHFYERLTPPNAPVAIITGGGGAPLYSISESPSYSQARIADRHTFTLVDVDGPKLKLRQLDANGEVVDTFELSVAK